MTTIERIIMLLGTHHGSLVIQNTNAAEEWKVSVTNSRLAFHFTRRGPDLNALLILALEEFGDAIA